MTAKEKPNVVFLMETKQLEVRVQYIQRYLKFYNSYILNPTSFVGGLALFWNDLIYLDVLRSTPNLFHISCREGRGGKLLSITFIHAPTNYQQHLLLWDDLRQIHASNGLPWLCVGDFNEILYPWEKMGKRPVNQFRMMSFRAVVNDCEFTELESHGCKYTWMNNKQGKSLLRKNWTEWYALWNGDFCFQGQRCMHF